MVRWLLLLVLCFASAAHAADGPTTPVPPVPTDSELFASMQVKLDSLNAQISSVESSIRVYQYLLTQTPPGSLADLIRATIRGMESKLILLRIERQQVLAAMAALNP